MSRDNILHKFGGILLEVVLQDSNQMEDKNKNSVGYSLLTYEYVLVAGYIFFDFYKIGF